MKVFLVATGLIFFASIGQAGTGSVTVKICKELKANLSQSKVQLQYLKEVAARSGTSPGLLELYESIDAQKQAVADAKELFHGNNCGQILFLNPF